MRALLAFVIVLLHTRSPAEDDVLGQNGFRYQVVHGWGVQALAGLKIKNGHAVVIDAKQRLFFLTDEPRNNVIILDSESGALLAHWTARMPGAHGMSLVREADGSEVLFITDTQLHEVRKMSLDGRELAVFPWPAEAKLHTHKNEYRPSKTIHFRDGSFAVFDGYGKDYIFHYRPDGSLLRSWGGDIGEEKDRLKHWGPHGGVFDDRDGLPRVVIAMSDQQELRRHSVEGRFLDQMPFPGGNPRDILPFGSFTIIPHLGDQWPKEKDSPGFISIVDSRWKIVSNIGAPAPVYENGILQPMRSDGRTFIHPHGVCADQEGNLFVAQFASPGAPLLKLRRLR